MPPIHQLSDDVLLQIFCFCLEGPGTLPPHPEDPRRALTQVCAQWRHTVTSTPAFWQNIGFSPVTFQNPSYLLDLAQLWIGRSGGHPLFLNMCKDLRHFKVPQRIEELLYGGGAFSIMDWILLPSAGRITSLTCLLSANDIITFLNLPGGTFLALEHCEITFLNNLTQPHSTFTFSESLNFTVFRSLPRLREATIHLLNGIHPLDLKLPWAQLTKLDLGSAVLSPDLFLRIMHRSSPTLLDAFFQIKFLPDQVTRHFPRLRRFLVVMPYLMRLRLRLVDPSCDSQFFNLLFLPALKCFRVERAEDEGWDLQLYRPLLISSTLEQLDLIDFPNALVAGSGAGPESRETSYEEMDNLMKNLPRLRHLRLPPGVYVHTRTIDKLANGEFLPFLQSLELSCTCVASGEYILSMVKRRNEMAFHRLFMPGPSSKPFSLFPLSYLCLLVLPNEKMLLEEQAAALRAVPCCSQTTVIIEARRSPVPSSSSSRNTALDHINL